MMGGLWITENDGGKWTELTSNLPEAGRASQWIVRIEPSNFDANVAYVATQLRIGSGDDRPMLLRTADLGKKTWQSVTG